MKPTQILSTILMVCLLASSMAAHHIMGIPHYSYDKHYPQAPVITYKIGAGPYILELTGYPGKPIPGELSQMHAYVYKKADKTQIFGGKIEASVTKDGIGGKKTVFGPVQTRFEDKLHKFSPIYGEAGKYHVRLEMMLEGKPYEIDFPILVGDPESPLGALIVWLGGLALLVIVIRAIKIKRGRRLATAA